MNIAYVSSEVAASQPIEQTELDGMLWLIGAQLTAAGPKSFVSLPIPAVLRLLKALTEAEKRFAAMMLTHFDPEGVKNAPAAG